MIRNMSLLFLSFEWKRMKIRVFVQWNEWVEIVYMDNRKGNGPEYWNAVCVVVKI